MCMCVRSYIIMRYINTNTYTSNNKNTYTPIYSPPHTFKDAGYGGGLIVYKYVQRGDNLKASFIRFCYAIVIIAVAAAAPYHTNNIHKSMYLVKVFVLLAIRWRRQHQQHVPFIWYTQPYQPVFVSYSHCGGLRTQRSPAPIPPPPPPAHIFYARHPICFAIIRGLKAGSICMQHI